MAIGYLMVQARTAHEAVPLSGIQVKVLDDRGNLLYNLTTDESGETLKVPLETLDKSFSQNQYFSGLPYLSYNVLAQGAGFNTLYITHIPVYEGETATLPLELVPMQPMQRRPEEKKIFIGKPAVAMRENRIQEGGAPSGGTQDDNASNGSLPSSDTLNGILPGDGAGNAIARGGEEASDGRVLRQVVIPNPITVHLGAPGSYATNVQVSFPDYVKNVASSEIYPTWPENALRANIYAIITFALNRVYTEWYRSRGYDYDITNSTAYDQNFVYGRPIYDSISRVVDDIFNEYVRRSGQNAPYFTSFCNGTTVTCKGMSQWGTVTLANRGLTPLEILRSYYPKDIEIVSTDIITNMVTSYPGTALRVGSTGLNVETIQKWLGRVRRNYPAIPVITDETGTFGDSTRAAVIQFQRIFGLSPDGIVGKSTWLKLSQIYTAVTRLAELDSEGDKLGIGTVPPSTVLRQGSTGQDVITLQYLLDFISEYYPGIPAPVQDGVFGSGTKQAVIAFQRAMGLTSDGIVGPATWKKLYEVYWGIHQNVPVPGPSPEPSPGPGAGSGSQEYVVRAGDSLWLIAQRYHTTVDAIKKLNGLTSDLINVGQVLKIPSSQSAPYFEYTVRPGDSLWLISRRYDTTVDAIRKLNGLTSDMLDVGQVLRIPAK